MLAVGIENNNELQSALEPVAQAGLDRFAFAAILRMNDDFGARFARALRGRIGRAVIDHEDMIELATRPLHDIARHVSLRDKRE